MLADLRLDPNASPYELDLQPRFEFLVPGSYVARMQTGTWYDPLLLQVLPRAQETEPKTGYDADPVGDLHAMPVRGLLHKYRTRALISTTNTCAVRCRYCFRRELPPEAFIAVHTGFESVWEYIRARPRIEEVILSGGDPLMLPSDRLVSVFEALLAIPHVHTVRIHTRVPIVMPTRIDSRLLSILEHVDSERRCVVVVHANCAEELVHDCAETISRLRRTGVLLLNQSVLLRGVNDTVEALERLCRRLVALGVLPYYLHQLDRAKGAWHFEVPQERGRHLISQLRKLLPGYAVPRYVKEHPGEGCKRPL